MSLLKQANATWSKRMIEAFTIDYNRVESSTATEDGDRIVVTLDSETGPTNVSLPTSEAPRLLTAVVTAAGMAVAAQKADRTLMVLGAHDVAIRIHPTKNEVLFIIALPGGAEMAFQTDRETATEFSDRCAQLLELAQAEQSSGRLQ